MVYVKECVRQKGYIERCVRKGIFTVICDRWFYATIGVLWDIHSHVCERWNFYSDG